MNFFADIRPTPMPSGSELAFVGAIRRAFRASEDMRNVLIHILVTPVYFGWPRGSTSKATVVSVGSWLLTMESVRPSVLPSQSVSVN